MTRRRPRAPRAASVALVVLASVAVTACSPDEQAPPDEPGSTAGPSTGADPTSLETTVVVGRVNGRLDERARAQLVQRVGPAVDTWVDRAYGGDYPRADFSGVFATFTRGAAALARAEPATMSNRAVGRRVDDVRPARRHLRLDVLAVDGRAVGVTARLDLVLELSGEVTRRDRITGTLLLTFEKSAAGAGWRVFGYDMSRGEV